MADVCVGSGSKRLLLMLALFLQALTAAADRALLFFWLCLFFFISLSLHTGRSVDRQIGTNISRRKQSGGILERSARPTALLVRPSIRRLPDLFWLNAAPPGDPLTLQRQPSCPHAVVSLVSRWQSLGIEKGTFPFTAHLKTMAIRHILKSLRSVYPCTTNTAAVYKPSMEARLQPRRLSCKH